MYQNESSYIVHFRFVTFSGSSASHGQCFWNCERKECRTQIEFEVNAVKTVTISSVGALWRGNYSGLVVDSELYCNIQSNICSGPLSSLGWRIRKNFRWSYLYIQANVTHILYFRTRQASLINTHGFVCVFTTLCLYSVCLHLSAGNQLYLYN